MTSRSTRALGHGVATTALVVLVCAVLGVLAALSFSDATTRLRPLTARATGTITAVTPDGTARVEWPGHLAAVDLVGALPKRGTATEIAFDPAAPEHAVIPGAALLAQSDRAAGGIVFATLVALGVLAAGSWRLVRCLLAIRRPAQLVEVRRIRVQSGLITRSWLETADDQWLPIYFDPALVTLPAPSTLRMFGDPGRHRWVAAEIPVPQGNPATTDGGTGTHHGDADGEFVSPATLSGSTTGSATDLVRLYPSGRVRRSEPRGRRTDNPARPDAAAFDRAAATGWIRQLRADAAMTVPAPLIGALWAYLDGSGFPGWLGATTVTAAVALWLAAHRGSDPT